VASVQAAQTRFNGLFFVGNHLHGVGVKDCALAGEQAANAVRDFLDITISTEDDE
tara:strand:- start:451 stop:615 length:165 start_codon:yes stop_codon:yes gene_type:complete